MATAPKNFYRGDLPTALTTVYTVPAGAKAIVTNIVATNNGPSTASVAVKVGGTFLIPNAGIATKGVLTLECSQVLDEGDSIQVQGNAVPAATHISGVEVA
ncbi:hypothetical protein [Streptomyces sp. NPDC092295]|uniref:hypothetical protein n=1 Tax=Streptomyces sp. NPDC092295 TaxID=3366011 RepID=UPI003813BA77